VLVIEVDDLDAMIERVVTHGGRMRFSESTPERMTLSAGADDDIPFAWTEFEDPEGNLVGLIRR